MSNSLGDAAVVRPRLDKFYLDRIDVVRAFPVRTFHDLVTLSRLAAWGLGPVPTAENLGHEGTTCRSKYRLLYFISISSSLFFFFLLIFLVIGITTMRENKEQTVTSGGTRMLLHLHWSK